MVAKTGQRVAANIHRTIQIHAGGLVVTADPGIVTAVLTQGGIRRQGNRPGPSQRVVVIILGFGLENTAIQGQRIGNGTVAGCRFNDRPRVQGHRPGAKGVDAVPNIQLAVAGAIHNRAAGVGVRPLHRQTGISTVHPIGDPTRTADRSGQGIAIIADLVPLLRAFITVVGHPDAARADIHWSGQNDLAAFIIAGHVKTVGYRNRPGPGLAVLVAAQVQIATVQEEGIRERTAVGISTRSRIEGHRAGAQRVGGREPKVAGIKYGAAAVGIVRRIERNIAPGHLYGQSAAGIFNDAVEGAARQIGAERKGDRVGPGVVHQAAAIQAAHRLRVALQIHEPVHRRFGVN